MQRYIIALAAAFGLTLGAGGAGAQGAARAAGTEVATAIQHAGFAAEGSDAEAVHLHLHHVINCLVGTHGQGFYASAGNPCEGQGQGAVADAATAGMHDAVRTRLDQALQLALIGVAIQGAQPARDVALAVKALLEETHEQMGGANG